MSIPCCFSGFNIPDELARERGRPVMPWRRKMSSYYEITHDLNGLNLFVHYGLGFGEIHGAARISCRNMRDGWEVESITVIGTNGRVGPAYRDGPIEIKHSQDPGSEWRLIEDALRIYRKEEIDEQLRELLSDPDSDVEDHEPRVPGRRRMMRASLSPMALHEKERGK